MFSSVYSASRWLLAPLAVAMATGCATQAASEGDEPTSTVEAVVHVERMATEEGASTSVSAKFMRILPADRAAAERLVGTRVVLPAVGECASVNALQADGATGKLKGSVELVDVGDLSLSARADAAAANGAAQNVELTLAPRAFADVGDVASGVFYTSPDAARDLPAPAKLVLHATGASAVEPFTIDLDAPAPPKNVRVAGRHFVGFPDAQSAPSDAPRIEAGRDFTLEWDATSDGVAETGELVYVEVHFAGSVVEPVRCAFRDTGSATVPGDVVARAEPGSVATLSLHRLREQEIRQELTEGQGAETMTVRFDLARSGRVAIAPSNRASR